MANLNYHTWVAAVCTLLMAMNIAHAVAQTSHCQMPPSSKNQKMFAPCLKYLTPLNRTVPASLPPIASSCCQNIRDTLLDGVCCTMRWHYTRSRFNFGDAVKFFRQCDGDIPHPYKCMNYVVTAAP
ncbi:hypothetical protein O6H91_23G000800 [Diphasiastrum complanatum]|uniref:Uncharacterized protein n=1 Tax=Diphasiastrum complanatum TaxID=34168 RepID=A0ACC2A7G3_DIPCM|nr:hypothetical protein O6H91_23G000800 [Diphasiastrum complanatum]